MIKTWTAAVRVAQRMALYLDRTVAIYPAPGRTWDVRPLGESGRVTRLVVRPDGSWS